jgi:nicotinamide mononucleotide adenylyltransferase
MINSFKHYLIEEEKTAYFTFGRMNPPTTGHEKLMNELSKKSGNNPYKIYLSQTADKKKNPLDFKYKVKTVRKFFPKHARNVMLSKKVRNVFDAATEMFNDGFKNVTMVVGSDRINEFSTLLKKYNGVKGRHGLYNFNKINVISAGDRDPDADDISGMSASKMRSLASEGDFTQFSQGLPRNVSNADAKKVYNEVRKGMGLKEQKEYYNKLHFEPVSEKREAYVKGNLFNIGDHVTVVGSDELASIASLGSNYVIVESGNKLYRKWLTDIELFEKTKSRQDKDISDKPGTQPAGYYKGLSKTTKDKRDSHFKKHAKMSDDNPAAYKKAPGDATAKTKLSKHTIKYRKMFGEDAVELAKKKIEREKTVDKMKHARMLDRAKVRKLKNRSKAYA